MTKNVLDYLYTSKEKFPLKTAVADNVSSMTYTELVDNATTIAVALLKYTGARRQFLYIWIKAVLHLRHLWV